jgi:hypothetical protein
VRVCNVRELLDADLSERVGEDTGVQGCRSRAVDVQMATVHSTWLADGEGHMVALENGGWIDIVRGFFGRN